MQNITLQRKDSTGRPDFEVSRDWLISRQFVFRVENAVLSRSMRFAPDGTITGYSHPNESLWAVADGDLCIMNAARQPTCILSFADDQDGYVTLSGTFIDVGLPPATNQNRHYIEEKRPDGASKVASFDLFDTLVARKCYDPISIFHAVELKSGVRDFARLRHEIEMRLFGRTLYGLHDVYAAMSTELNWPPDLGSKLEALELTEEWDNLFPIAEIVALVKPSDLVISDMYLPYEFIQKVVEEKCGLRGRRIVLSNYGKHLGMVWPQVLAQHEITRHYGDNAHADVASPTRFGIPTHHVTVSGWTPAERVLVEIGLRDCACAVREARLRDDAQTAAERGVHAAQFGLNLPLLIVGAYFLMQISREFGADRLLLCARDCNLLEQVIHALAKQSAYPIAARYIRASRNLFNSDAPEYEVYFRHHLGQRNLLVDLSGTGQSIARFIKSAKLDACVKPVLVIGDPATDEFNEIKVDSLIKKEFLPVRLAMEALNTSLDGSAVSASAKNFVVEIGLAPNEFSSDAQRLIAQTRDIVGSVIGLFEENSGQLPRDIPRERLSQAANALMALIPNHWEGILPLVSEQAQNLRHE